MKPCWQTSRHINKQTDTEETEPLWWKYICKYKTQVKKYWEHGECSPKRSAFVYDFHLTVHRDLQHISRNSELSSEVTLQLLDAETDGEGHGHHMTLWYQNHLHCRRTETLRHAAGSCLKSVSYVAGFYCDSEFLEGSYKDVFRRIQRFIL